MALQAIIMNDGNTYDIIIIGGGPAAFAAAIYLRRGNYKVGYIEKNIPGGKLVNIESIQNYPGFKSIKGADLALNMYEQAEALGVDSLYGEVTQLNRYKDYHVIYTNDGKTRYTKVLIVATGTSLKKIDAENYDQFLNKGISHCVTCDGPLAKNKDVAITGSLTPTIATNAIYLAKICRKVYLINKTKKLDINEQLMKLLTKFENIEIINDCEITEINGDKVVNGVKLSNKKELEVSFVFVYNGTKPNTELLKNYKILDKQGFVIVNNKMETGIPGLYAIGDVTNIPYKTIVNAIGQGAIAATEAMDYMSKK